MNERLRHARPAERRSIWRQPHSAVLSPRDRTPESQARREQHVTRRDHGACDSGAAENGTQARVQRLTGKSRSGALARDWLIASCSARAVADFDRAQNPRCSLRNKHFEGQPGARRVGNSVENPRLPLRIEVAASPRGPLQMRAAAQKRAGWANHANGARLNHFMGAAQLINAVHGRNFPRVWTALSATPPTYLPWPEVGDHDVRRVRRIGPVASTCKQARALRLRAVPEHPRLDASGVSSRSMKNSVQHARKRLGLVVLWRTSSMGPPFAGRLKSRSFGLS